MWAFDEDINLVDNDNEYNNSPHGIIKTLCFLLKYNSLNLIFWIDTIQYDNRTHVLVEKILCTIFNQKDF